MTIYVTGPNGITVDFPDSTDPATINAVMRQNFSVQSAAPPEVPGTGKATPDNRSWLERAQSPDNPLGATLKAPDMFLRGMTGTASDYAEAGVNRMMGSAPTYDAALRGVTRKYDQARTNAPVLSTAMEIGGAVTSPIFRAVGAGMGKVSGAADTAAKALTGRNLPQFLKYGIEGLGLGGAYGLPMARSQEGGVPSLLDLGATTAGAATAGGLLGAATPAAVQAGAAIGRGAGRMAQPLLDRLPQNQASASARIVAKRLQDQGMTVDQAEAELRRLGPQATLADLGKSTARLADNMAQNPGQTAQFAEKVLGDRSASQGSRLADSVRGNISGKGFYDEKAILDEAKKKSGPLFQQAFEKETSVTSPGLQLLLEQEPLVMSGIKKGLELERIEASTARQRFQPQQYGVVQFNDAGEPILGKITPLRLWHSAKKGLDDILEGYRDTTTGKLVLDQKGNRIVALRKSLDDELKDLTGGQSGTYARANAAYAGPAKINDAMYLGRAFARGDEEITAKVFNAFSDAEKEAYRTGAAREIVGMIRKSGQAPPAFKNALRDTAVRDKLRIIAPTPEKYNRFINDIEREVRFQNTSNTVRGGSQTAQRGFEDADVAANVAADLGGAAIEAAKGNFGGAISRTAQYGLNQLRKITVSQSVRDRIGKMLLSQDPIDQAAAFRELRNYQKKVPMFTPSRQFLSESSRAGAVSAPIIGASNQ